MTCNTKFTPILLAIPFTCLALSLPTPPPAQASEADQKCITVARQAQQIIENSGQVQVARLDARWISQRYATYPKNAPVELVIGLAGRDANRFLLKSPSLMLNLTQTIIEECPQIGMVTFGKDQTGLMTIFGQINNRISAFQCYGSDPNKMPKKLPWGYQYCF
jgi:hypothetical protein